MGGAYFLEFETHSKLATFKNFSKSRSAIFLKFKKKKDTSVKRSTTQSHSTSRWNSSQLNSPLGQYPMHSEEKYKCSFFSVLASWAEFLLGIKRNKYEWLSRRHTVKLPFITNIVCPCIMKHDQPRYQYKKYLSSIS